MHIWYRDILSRIPAEPVWWNNGVPRYEPFTPDEATVYGKQVALVRGVCQYCRREFRIAELQTGIDLRDHLTLYGDLSPGDPPFHLGEDGYNCVGNAQLMETHEILEFWIEDRSEVPFVWRRDATAEQLLPEADDFVGGRAGIFERAAEAGLDTELTRLEKAKDETGLAALLERIGFRDPAYFAKLWLVRNDRNAAITLSHEHHRQMR